MVRDEASFIESDRRWMPALALSPARPVTSFEAGGQGGAAEAEEGGRVAELGVADAHAIHEGLKFSVAASGEDDGAAGGEAIGEQLQVAARVAIEGIGADHGQVDGGGGGGVFEEAGDGG